MRVRKSGLCLAMGDFVFSGVINGNGGVLTWKL